MKFRARESSTSVAEHRVRSASEDKRDAPAHRTDATDEIDAMTLDEHARAFMAYIPGLL